MAKKSMDGVAKPYLEGLTRGENRNGKTSDNKGYCHNEHKPMDADLSGTMKFLESQDSMEHYDIAGKYGKDSGKGGRVVEE